MHSLLERELEELGIPEETGPTPTQWRALRERLSAKLEAHQHEASAREAQQAQQTAALQKQSDELASRLALMTSVQESVREAIVVVDCNLSVLWFNRHFVELWHVPPEVVERASTPELLDPVIALVADAERFLARIREIHAAPEATSTDELELTDGRIISRYSAPVIAFDGKVEGRVWCFRDVTEKRRLAARRAVVAERMASVGQLVASVAHEINNPLAYIDGNVEVVMEALENEDEAPELVTALADARAGVERIKVIVRDLRVLSRIDDETREPTDLHAVLEAALQMANNELRHHAQVIRELGTVPLVSANGVRLTQVFLNLLVNAAHALPVGRASANTVTVRTSTSACGGARIEIEDTGTGIAPEHLERIFDPFFTTKQLGAGTGLGLSICKGIIDKLGGSIEVESRPGVGTTFTVELPPGMPPSRRPGRTSLTPASKRGARRSILVVDDDAHIRRWLERVLAHHEVTTVTSVDAAEQAISVCSFDVIVCDVMMPDRTGLDMYGVIQRKHPELLSRVVFISGGVFTPKLSSFIENVSNPCLRKPFTKNELERAIEAVAPARAGAPRLDDQTH
ncbi:MAG TPA: ATP-binding protein [Labilithrix sp.]|nr:ATP-binding protein [Labilithrix sp.]